MILKYLLEKRGYMLEGKNVSICFESEVCSPALCLPKHKVAITATG